MVLLLPLAGPKAGEADLGTTPETIYIWLPGRCERSRERHGSRVSSGPASRALPSALKGSTVLYSSIREYNRAVKRRDTVYSPGIPVHNPCSTTQASFHYMPKEAYIVKAHASVSIPGFWPFRKLAFPFLGIQAQCHLLLLGFKHLPRHKESNKQS